MTTLALLTKEEQLQYDYPPVLNVEERIACFTLSDAIAAKIKRLRTATNKVAFLLQYAYFKRCHRFYPIQRFSVTDVQVAAEQLGLSIKTIDFSTYHYTTAKTHRTTICALTGYQPFNETQATWLAQEIKCRVEQFVNPRTLFNELIQLLESHQIELPSYRRLSEMLSHHYGAYEKQLIAIIRQKPYQALRSSLDPLRNTEKQFSPGLLNQLKRINQSKKPKGIASSMATFQHVSKLFNAILPLMKALNLTAHGLAYYATWVMKAKLSQIKQFPDDDKMILYLVAFIQDQYYCRQDTFVDIFLKAVKTAQNTARIRLKENDYVTRNERQSAVRYMTKSNKSYKQLVTDIREAICSPLLTDAGKIEKITALLEQQEKEQGTVAPETQDAYEQSLDHIVDDNDYFDILEKLSTKLQNKVSGILRVLRFNTTNSDAILTEAITAYQNNEGKVSARSPINFLSEKEKKALRDKHGKFRSSLYKILLFIHSADGIKSGALNLMYSYRYLSINDYLIDPVRWEKEYHALLKRTGLSDFSDADQVISALKILLNEKYERVNSRCNADRNPYLSINEAGRVCIKTPAAEEKETEHIGAFLSQKNYIPIGEVLSAINDITQFSQHFQHHTIKYSKSIPKFTVFSAGIIGLGCNIGIQKMSHITAGINQYTLQNTVNWYFSVKNIIAANQAILEFFDRLSLTHVFTTSGDNKKHASSDGRKVNVAVPCLLASRSFKYFGKGSGVSVYTFIDERQVLFYSTVISASAREAAYVIDGLNHHKVIKVDIHSTDSHGYTELIFATTHFMRTSFAPRLKHISQQRIYGFSTAETYKKKGYQIVPSRTINQKLIKAHWEDILRFMVTIKLKVVSASQLFKRLSSYAKDNPLYKAIKEFGRIIKSLFILTYYDDVNLRQRIEKQLNRIELSNKFGRAVFYDNSGEFKQASQEEQQMITGCTVLIQNAIVLWNYLYLSQLIADCEDDEERMEIIDMVRHGSIMHWSHVNLHGEFDFRRPAANETYFDVQKILNLEIV